MNPKSSYAWLYIISFTDLFGVSLVVPLLSPYLKTMGASHTIIGLSGSLYATLQLISSPIIGSWSDIYGRCPVMIVTMVICTFSYSCMGFTSSINVFLLMRVLLGTFKHTQTLTKALAADIVPADQQSNVHGKLSSISGIGFMVGPAIGGHLAELNNGYFYVLQLVATLFLINAGIAYMFMQNLPPANVTKKRNDTPHTGLLQVFYELSEVEWKLYWDLFAMKLLLAFSQSIFFSNFSLNMKEWFDLSPKFVGYMISFIGMISAIAGFSAGLVDTIYNKYSSQEMRNFHAFLLLSISFLILGSTRNLTVFILALIPVSVCFSLLRIIGTKMVIERTALNKRGSVIGSVNSLSSIARLVGPLCSGVALDFMGHFGITLLSIVSSVSGALISLLVIQMKQHQS